MTTQSAFLRSLADHLDEHDVMSVIVGWYPWMGTRDNPIQLQLTATDLGEPEDPIGHLVAWAASLGVATARIRIVSGRVFVHVRGQIGEWHVDVWDTIEQGAELVDRGTISVAELVAIAARATTGGAA